MKVHSPRAVRAEPDAVKCATQLRLVFRMTLQVAQLMHPMSKLTLITVFAFASFLERAAQLRLVAVEGEWLG